MRAGASFRDGRRIYGRPGCGDALLELQVRLGAEATVAWDAARSLPCHTRLPLFWHVLGCD